MVLTRTDNNLSIEIKEGGKTPFAKSLMCPTKVRKFYLVGNGSFTEIVAGNNIFEDIIFSTNYHKLRSSK